MDMEIDAMPHEEEDEVEGTIEPQHVGPSKKDEREDAGCDDSADEDVGSPQPSSAANHATTSTPTHRNSNNNDNNNNNNDLPPPRLMITQMILENFKSYAGTQIIGPFHKNFAAVVGPNGSGKSNVIDALLFVFGKRAKQLRLNKVKELIHQSSHHKSLTRATVSVYLQEIQDTGPGDDDYIVVPHSECVISRVARSDNTSTYKLNGKNTQFKDIATVLQSKGIDLDNNRFLILQGEVELISMMPPKGLKDGDDGLLEYLEDIIGSNKFVEETQHVLVQVETLSEQRNSHLQRVKGIQSELQSLESAKLEAQALLTKERDIRRKQNILCQLQLHDTSQQREQRSQQLHIVRDQLTVEREKLSHASQRLLELEQGQVQQQRDYDTIYNELVQTKNEFTKFERHDIQIQEEIKHWHTTKKKLMTKLDTERTKQATAETKLQQAQDSIPTLESKLEDLVEEQEQQTVVLEEIFDERKGVTQVLRSKLEHKQEKLAPVQQQLADYQNHLDTAQTEVDLWQSSTKNAQMRLNTAKTELNQLDHKQDTTQTKIEEMQTELNDAKHRLIEVEQEDNEIAQKEVQLATRYKQCMAMAEEAKAALQSIGGGRSRAVQAILEASKPGGELAKMGVLGRLGDLATIAEEYDVAVSTACGMLDHIVVQTTAGGQKCLDFLRRTNAGRANLIALDKLKKGAHDIVPQTPEGAPLLFALIQPKHFSVVPALHLGVGHTLVAPDLATATRWAYEFGKRWRVVTLDGKLIETSGTMSGGGKSVRRGGMLLANKRSAGSLNELDDEALDCQRLEEEAQKAESFLKECRSRRKELSEEIRNLKKLIKHHEAQLPMLAVELNSYDTTRIELTKLIPELESQCQLSNADAAKLNELQDKVQACEADMASCVKLAASLEAEVAALQQEILDAGGPRLKKQQDICDKLRKQINDTEKALNAAKVAVTSSEKAVLKAKEAQETAQRQLDECLQGLEAKKSERKTIEEHAFAVMQSYEKVKEIEAEKRAALDEVNNECEELRKSQSDVKVLEIELLSKTDGLEKQLAELDKKQQHWLASIEKLNKDMQNDEDFEDNVDGGSDSDDVEMSDASDEQATVDPAITEKIRSALPTYTPSALENFSIETIKEEISILETERNTIAKTANMGAIAEYRKKEADYMARVAALDEVTNERNTARKTYDDLRRMRLEMFMDGFGRITLKLKEMYQMITLGGDAELELVDSLDPFSEGIVFSVRPPKKSWKNISNLSGGEKTLSSLALVFALHHFKPTPLYVMDEIDAALDFKNVSIVANYIKERTKNAQFVIISLRNNMFELADRLVGIYKTNNCTKSVSINPKAFGVDCRQNGMLTATPALSENTNQRPRGVEASGVKSLTRRVSFRSESNHIVPE